MTKSRPLLESFITSYMPEPWGGVIYDMWHISVDLTTSYWPVSGSSGMLGLLPPPKPTPHITCIIKDSPFFYTHGIFLTKTLEPVPDVTIDITNPIYGSIQISIPCTKASRPNTKDCTMDATITGNISFGDLATVNNAIRASISDTYETLYEEAQRFGLYPF